jgi:integrase
VRLLRTTHHEAIALKWADVDWLNGTLRVDRNIVERNVDDVKTDESRKSWSLAENLLDRLKVWKEATEFSAEGDWIFASPVKIGRLPYCYTGVWRELNRASKAAGLKHMGTHTFRHSYRMWIDAIGTPIGVQQELMRQSDIRTTMNICGDAATEDMREAHTKVVRLALQKHVNGTENGTHGLLTY